MGNKYIIVCLLIMCTDHYGSDMALKNFKISNLQNIFKKTPKIWHTYIRIFIYRYLKNDQVEIVPKINLFKIFRYSLFFMRLKDKSLETRGVFQGESPYGINIKWTSGQMFLTVQNYIIVPHIFEFFFNANPRITMNITFYIIYLKEPSANCKHDKLVVGEKGEISLLF